LYSNDPPTTEIYTLSLHDALPIFKGKAMTYYGRWTYKYEIAAEKGAAAAVIVHETIPAAYPWSVVANSNAKENFVIDAPDKNMRSEEHTSELQSRGHLVCRLLLEK